jgi:hypothetical protein
VGLKLSAAFAGYFVIILLVLYQWNKIIPGPGSDVWEVNGRIMLDGKPLETLAVDDVTVSPSSLTILGGGRFRAKFVPIAETSPEHFHYLAYDARCRNSFAGTAGRRV